MRRRVPRASIRHPLAPIGRASLVAAALTAILAAHPRALRAGTEEFSTFSVETQEEDDESLIDHMLNRTPRAWRDEWEHATLAVRTAQGCLTSGQWIEQTDLKLRTSLGGRAWFGLNLIRSFDDRATYDYTDLSFHVPTRYGTGGFMFRPFHDKSRQDMALMWDVGADTSTFQMRAVFGLEDVFNNLWEFRQSRVGEASEPYLRHPWEPGLAFRLRRPTVRAEAGGRYLTPSTKQIVISVADPSLDRIRTLWGTLAWASFEAEALGLVWQVAGTDKQARSTDYAVAAPEPDGTDYRRQWWVEASARRRFGERFEAEGRWLYQDRTQYHAAPITPPRFAAVDRMLQLETQWTASSHLGVRFGGLYDRISVQQSGVTQDKSFGSRTESRLYVGLVGRFGRVSLMGVEGIELDPEPYEVWGVHDKGFLQLQATF